jgi:Fe2+ or Zn2+ uptake regulation protein
MAISVSRLLKKKGLQQICNTSSAAALRVLDGQRAPKSPGYAHADNTQAEGRVSRYFEQTLAARGIRLTEQRRCILRVIEESPRCCNVGVIHRRARKLNSAVHRVTVYRTLELLKRYGILPEPGNFETCAEDSSCPRAGECEQIKMKCLHCGKSVRFKSCMVGELMRCVEKDCRFSVSRASVDIAGYCQHCRV